jgi:prophage regulatory protein
MVKIIRHSDICKMLTLSSAKLHDMTAKGQFPKGFLIVPGGRAVGWLESDVIAWIEARHAAAEQYEGDEGEVAN